MKPKATILKVGTVDRNVIRGWSFDCNGNVPFIEIINDHFLLAGYSIQELSEIASRPSEWI